MNDYSEVTCHLQRDVVNLINALNDKKWKVAQDIADQLNADMFDLAIWLQKEMNK